MAARLGFILILVLGVAALLGWFDVLPVRTWLGLGERAPKDRGGEAPLDAATEAGEAAALAGRAGDPAGEAGGAGASATTALPSETKGTAEAGGAIRGRVVRAPGEIPVEGARVLLVRPDPLLAYLRGSRAGRHDRLEARSGKDGRFSFSHVIPAEGYFVRASLPSGPVATSEEVDLRGRVTRDVGDLVLGPSGALEGRVVDGSGRPVSDARVAVSWPVRNALDIVLADPDTLEEIEREVRTREDGSFAANGLEPGRKTLIVASPTAGAEVRQSLTVGAGEPTRMGDVVLAGTKSLAGRVESEDGSPIPGARVYAVVLGNSAVRTSETLADGSFRIAHLAEGNYRIGVLVAGMPAKVTQEEHAAGTEDVVIRFPRTGRIEGRVVEKGSGAPVRRFTVRVEGGQANLMEQLVRRMMARTLGGTPFQDPEGRFVVEGAFPGKTRVVVAAEGFPETTSEPVEVAPGATASVRIELPAGNGARGVVRHHDGQPAAGAEIYVADPKDVVADEDEGEVRMSFSFDRPADAVADAEGRFTLPPQTPGVYELTATVPRRLPAVVKVDLSRPLATDVEIRLPPSARIEGRVLDDGGQPVPFGAVVVWYAQGDPWEVTADDRGDYSVEPARPGRAVIRWRSLREARSVFESQPEGEAERQARYEALRREGGEVEIVADRTLKADVRMPRLVRWNGVLRIDGKPTAGPAGGFYTALRGGGGTWVPVEAGGAFSILVEPGTYQTWTPDADGDWGGGEVEVPPGGGTFTADVGR